MNIVAVSSFSSRLGIFTPFQGNKNLTIVDPFIRPNAEFMGRFSYVGEHYYLTPAIQRDLLIAGLPCRCCFDSYHLDILKGILDLQSIGSMAFLILSPNNWPMLSFLSKNNFLFDAMEKAGFQHIFIDPYSLETKPNESTFLKRFLSNRPETEAYVVFQRIVKNANSTEILKSAVDWESHRLAQESAQYEEIPEIKDRLQRFRESLY